MRASKRATNADVSVQMPPSRRFSVFTTPAFITALALLLLNDWYLKANYPGWLSGKLSDFAGLAVVSLLVFSLLRWRPRISGCIIGLLFIWWKSPYSGFVIDAVNATGLAHIARVVDYSDLIALVTIPLSVAFFESHDRPRAATSALPRRGAIPVLLIALFGVTGTSVAPYTRVFVIQDLRRETVFSYDEIENTLASLAGSEELECTAPGASSQSTERLCQIDDVWLRYRIERGQVHFRVEDYPPLFGSGRRMKRNVNELIEEIKVAFSSQGGDLEYVEPLTDPESR